jgi:hypothetical protein
MHNVLRKFSLLTWVFLLVLTIASVASASELGPRRKPGNRDRRPSPPVSVAEPAAIALLGAGLVSLGIYANKKRTKKQ